MGFFDRVRGMFGMGPSVPSSVPVESGLAVTSSGVRGPARRGTRELIAAYRDQPWLRAVTSRIARGVASVGWSVYARSVVPVATKAALRARQGPNGSFRDVAEAPLWRWGVDRGRADRLLGAADYGSRARRRRDLASAGELREICDHPALDVLACPNPFMTGRTALAMTQTWLDIKGEAFWLLDLGADGLPAGFLPVPPHWITQCPTDASPFFRISFSGLQLTVKPEAVIWFKDADPENPYGRGTGIAESLGDELETDEYAAKFIKAWFFNSALPSFIVAFEGAQPEQLKRAKEQWEADHRGAANAHRAHFASGKMNAQRLDASFRDQQLIDLRKLSRDTIAQVFAMPPELLGIIENSNRSTINAARFIYVLGVEWPRAEFLRSEIQLQFLSRWDPALTLEAEVSLPDDEDRRLAVMVAQPGAFALNEWRAEAGHSPLPEFDGVFPPLAQPGQVVGDVAADAEEEPNELESDDVAEAEGEERAQPRLRAAK
jgi:HK97 family phage portal protein